VCYHANYPMQFLIRLLGSLAVAVVLLIVIATILAWGTIYEARFGTAAAQRFIYHAWWFQSILAFLAVNLAVAAFHRYPWKRKHTPFLLAHVGIIFILIGGIIGGRFGIDGQLIIPEGEASRTLEISSNVIVVHQPNPGTHQVFPTRFSSQAWIHEPNLVLPATLNDHTIELTVDRYYPDSMVTEDIADDGAIENPAVSLLITHQESEESVWLFARDPERFGIVWGEVHVLFLEPESPEQLEWLLVESNDTDPARGKLTLVFAESERTHQIAVPDVFGRTIKIEGTPYVITFRDYFADLAVTEQGLISRSEIPNNPAVSFMLRGPEGTDAYLLFARHPDFSLVHEQTYTIPADITYTHAVVSQIPPNTFAVIRLPQGDLAALATGPSSERQVIEHIEPGSRIAHPWLDYQVEILEYKQHAVIRQDIILRSEEVRAEAIHIIARDGEHTADGWLSLGGSTNLSLGAENLVVEYRQARMELPFTVKLMDFRKIDYPGTNMAAGFESDVQLTDMEAGIILMRTISMNHPLKYRGFSLFQSSYIPGPVETTILSVRNDPGTPLVYAGFIIVVLGVVAMFILHARKAKSLSALK